MKMLKKLSAAFCTAALLVSSVFSFGASAASAATTKFLDPYDDSTFPKAYKTNVTLPEKYDVTYDKVMANGGVFGPNEDRKALAALMNKKAVPLFKEVLGASYMSSRKTTLMKNYVRCKLELIYKFDNGFSDFEFMGVCGATGNWAGAWGKSDTVEFSYSATENGSYTKLNYDKIRNMPAGQDSTYCTFASKVPTTARFLKITFLDSSKYDEATKEYVTQYENWACALGYLLVNQYNEPQSSGGTTSQGGSSQGGTASSGSSSGSASQDASSDGQNDASEASSGEDTSSVSSEGTQSDENSSNTASADDYYTEVTREIDWKITGIIIGADALCLGGAVAVLIVLYRKKLKQLGIKK